MFSDSTEGGDVLKKVFYLVLLAAVCLTLVNGVSAKQTWRRYDVNQDSRVDVRDLAIMAKVYGSYFLHSNWDKRFDFDGDGEVSIKDIALIAKHFGTYVAK